LIFLRVSAIVRNFSAVQEKAHLATQDLWWLADRASCRRRPAALSSQ
jgi:hypothetical protein